MNSTPPCSSAAFIASNVRRFCISGTPETDSILLIVDKLIPERLDKSSPDHLRIALAALTCSEEIIDIITFLYDTNSVINGLILII